MANQATVTIHSEMPSKSYNPMIFDGFMEYFGRQVYGGVFEPGSPMAYHKGFRIDVSTERIKCPHYSMAWWVFCGCVSLVERI